MCILKKLFKRRTEPTMGITIDELKRIYDALECEYEEAKARQKTDDAEPSRYMQGLIFALCELEKFPPHKLEVNNGK